MRDSARELIETQSQVADLEDKLMTTQQQLISVKASWAEAAHEKEQHYNQALEYAEKVQELEEQILASREQASKQQDERGRHGRPVSITTTKTSSTS